MHVTSQELGCQQQAIYCSISVCSACPQSPSCGRQPVNVVTLNWTMRQHTGALFPEVRPAKLAHRYTNISVHLYTVYALWCVYSEAKIALREKQAIVSFLMSGWWDFELGSDSHHFVHQRPIRHTGRRLPQWAGRGAVFKSDCRILIIAIGNICSVSYFHYCNDSLLLIQLTAHPVILWGLQKFSEMQVHQILNFSDIKDPAYLN